MRRVERSALVPYSAEKMFRLVDDIESYPGFLPWCNDARIDSRDGDVLIATLELHRGGISKHFTTRNIRREFSAIDLSLVGGPFRALTGGWHFDELEGQGCKVSLQLEFAFENRLVDMMFGAFFEDTCNALVDAFTQRANTVYANAH